MSNEDAHAYRIEQALIVGPTWAELQDGEDWEAWAQRILPSLDTADLHTINNDEVPEHLTAAVGNTHYFHRTAQVRTHGFLELRKAAKARTAQRMSGWLG